MNAHTQKLHNDRRRFIRKLYFLEQITLEFGERIELLRKTVSGIMLTLLILSMFTLAFNIQPSEAETATIIVPDDYPTIQEAISHANDGDTVYVRAGTYYEHVTINKTILLVGENKNKTIIDGNGSYEVVRITFAQNVVISGFTIRGGYASNVFVIRSFNCTISNNIIQGSRIYGGIWLYQSENNIIKENLVLNNSYGLFVTNDAKDNKIYHNDFVENIQQVFIEVKINFWDDGYPSGGNYWSDYTGVDLKSGPNQDQPGGDGIGDAPYIIDDYNRDRYPLMKPWTPTPLPNLLVSLSAWTFHPPTIDGIISISEWHHAAQVEFVMGNVSGMIYEMNDETNLYLGVKLNESFPDLFKIIFEFDNDNDGNDPMQGDDLIFASYTSEFIGTDAYWDSNRSDFMQDPIHDLQYMVNEATSSVEFSKTLHSGDPHDFALHAGDNVGFQMSYWHSNLKLVGSFPGNRTGSGFPGHGTGDHGVHSTFGQIAIAEEGPACGIPVLISPLEISPGTPYYVGDTLTAKFTIKNVGDAAITLDKLLVGGRFNGGTLPNGLFPDFTFQPVTLQPGQSHLYEGTLEPTEAGNYHFFVAYYIENPTAEEKHLLDENNWNTCVQLGEGLTDADRVKDIMVKVSEEWTFAIITDLHVGRGYSDYSKEDYYLTARLQTVVDWINAHAATDNIRFVVVLGDITEDGAQVEMQKANEILDGLGEIPYFPVIGNHDINDSVFEGVFDNNFFTAQCGKLGVEWINRRVHVPVDLDPYVPGAEMEWRLQNYAFEYQGKNFVFLDFVDREALFGTPKLESETMDFLREQLNGAEPTILFSHHPMIESEANFHQGTLDDSWTPLNDCISQANANILANFAGHVHGYYDPSPLKEFDPQEFIDAAHALAEQEAHPTLLLKTPQFYNASYNYKGSVFATADDRPVITTEAMMVGSNTNAKNGIIRIVSVTEDSFDTWTPEDTAFPSLNPYIISATTSWGGQGLRENEVDFQVYAFTTIFSPTQLINYSLYVDGDFRRWIEAEPYVLVEFENQRLSHGTHEVNLTVVGYAPDGSPVVESIKRTVIVGKLSVHLRCPADIVVTDPAGRSISKQVNEIPEATYTETDLDADGDLDKIVEILAPIEGDYMFTLNGTGLGSYSMIVQFATSEEVVSFSATEIPVSVGEVHQYAIDWTALSQDREGVIVQVDSNGDGVFEHTFTSDSELTQTEYVIATDNTPPETQLNIGEPRLVVNGITYLTSATPTELIAEDDLAGSGVASTAYRIHNASYDSGWKTYTHPFLLIGLSDGVYHIDYNSTDYAGNVELTHTIQVTLFSWNYIFEDTYGRGTTLKINIAYKFFQFITPDKDYGIVKATYMRQSGRAIIISHLDKQLQLITVAVDTKLDFCLAAAWDRQTRKQYFLVDKLGIEK